MGGEIFEDSLRNFEGKPKQKFQKIISLETRENSQQFDINTVRYDINVIIEIKSQRNIGNKNSRKEYISKLFLDKIAFEIKLLSLIVNRHRNRYKCLNIYKNSIADMEYKPPKTSDGTLEKNFDCKILSLELDNIPFKPKHNGTNNANENFNLNIKNTTYYGEKINHNAAEHMKKMNLLKSLIKLELLEKFYNLNKGNNLSSKIFDSGTNIDRQKWYPGVNNTIKSISLLVKNYNIIDEYKFILKVMYIIYDRKIIIGVDKDIYMEFKGILVPEIVAKKNDSINISYIRWYTALLALNDITGYKIFNDNYGKLTIKFGTECMDFNFLIEQTYLVHNEI